MDTHQQKSNQVALSSLESFDHATKKDHGWFHVEWFMGRRCNYDCSYCSALEHDNISPHVKFEDIQNMVEQIKNHVQGNKKIKLTLTGGEPFVHPKFLDILELVHEQLSPEQVGITTNGSVPTQKYIDASRYATHFTVSMHLERTEKELQKIYENALAIKQQGVWVTITLMLLPGKLDKVKTLTKMFEQDDINYTVREIQPNFTANGRMIRPYESGYQLTKHIKNDEAFRYDNRQANTQKTLEQYYSREEKDYLSDKKTTWNNVRVHYEDGSSEETHTDQLISAERNNFKGWTCYVGTDQIYVDEVGKVWTALCRQKGVIGHINSKINFPKPFACALSYCTCNNNIWTRKYKEPKHKHLITDHLTEV